MQDPIPIPDRSRAPNTTLPAPHSPPFSYPSIFAAVCCPAPAPPLVCLFIFFSLCPASAQTSGSTNHHIH